MKRNRLFFAFCISALSVLSQSYDTERIGIGNFAQRLYLNSPFEGCRIIDDYDKSYLLSVVVIDESKYRTTSQVNRMAQVKSQRNAGEFLNGSASYSEFVVQTPRSEASGTSKDIMETLDYIKVNTTGFVQQMQLLVTFEDENAQKVYIFYNEMNQLGRVF